MDPKLHLSLADRIDHVQIDRMRHRIYATELGQFAPRADGILRDRPEVESTYIKALDNGKLVGFVGITAPESPAYSIDHYVSRRNTPLTYDEHLFEIRALTVVDSARGSMVAAALMYAAFRWVQAHGGRQIVAIGHQKVIPMYERMGMRPIGIAFACGRLQYELLSAPVDTIETELTRFDARLNRLEKQVLWHLDIPFRIPADCYHGGAFFNAIGNRFDHLIRRNEIINADVLDAWFPPCPEALQALHEHLGWIARTSPPTHAEGLVQAIAEARGVKPQHILAGGGSSPLIFQTLCHWLNASSKVLLLDPTYGEYAHVLENVVKCRVDRFKLHREDGYRMDLEELSRSLSRNYDLFVWVNPNSPTGRHVAREDVESVLEQCPSSTRIWIDETYVEYAGSEHSLETYASSHFNTVVCKSMSKGYGLSGLRIGYLCGSPALLEPLRLFMPPWSVSLPAQVAAIHALKSADYYRDCYAKTHQLRTVLSLDLLRLGIHEIIPGIANFLLFHLPDSAPDAATVITR